MMRLIVAGTRNFDNYELLKASVDDFIELHGDRNFKDDEAIVGGVGTLDHLYEGFSKGHASAVLAASIFHYGEYSIKQSKEYLLNKGVKIRP
jgi:hypothetical protein